MNRLTLAILLGTAAATAVAWRLGGPLGTGVLAGFTAAAVFTALGIA